MVWSCESVVDIDGINATVYIVSAVRAQVYYQYGGNVLNGYLIPVVCQKIDHVIHS